MSARAFSEPSVRERVVAAVAALERRTAAEIVVAVRPVSGRYRDADYLFAALAALAVTLVFVFHPRPFRSELFPVELALAFVLGAVFSANLPVLRRHLVSRSRLREEVDRAAKVAFLELGVDRTRGRTGVLLFLSLFEREAAVVVDAGIDPESLGDDWKRVLASVRHAAHAADPDALVKAIEALGPSLEAGLPRSPDDVDEIDNALRVA